MFVPTRLYCKILSSLLKYVVLQSECMIYNGPKTLGNNNKPKDVTYNATFGAFDKSQYSIVNNCTNENCVCPYHLKMVKNEEKAFWEFFDHTTKVKCDSLIITTNQTRNYDNRFPVNDCLIYNGKTGTRGYARKKIWHTTLGCHRVAYKMFCPSFDINDSKIYIRHLCNNKKCINPNHLTTGTSEDNAKDRIKHGTSLKGEKNHMATITKELALEIYQSRDMIGENGKKLTKQQRANMFKVSKKIVQNIDWGMTWNHVTHAKNEEKQRQKRHARNKRKRELFDEKDDDGQNTQLYVMSILDAVQRLLREMVTDEKTGCWYLPNRDKNYYTTKWARGRNHCSHELMWEFWINNGKRKPSHLVVRHLCHIKGCFNPMHLEIGTQSDNMNDTYKRKRIESKQQ